MYTSSTPTRNIFTVSKLNKLARTILESEIGQIWLTGEISNFVAAASGHWYFTLKDSKAQVKGAMFRNANTRVQTRPKEGDKVLVRANISLYEPRGDYQMIVEHIEPEGTGLLKQQFEALKLALSAEGLFSQHLKKLLPAHPTKIGVITSPSGAALHDMLTVLNRRNPAIEIIVYPTLVQGESAPDAIAQAIQQADQRNETDILIVGRGGGSMEDLWAFNDERVARAIFSATLPIISAVGHETDVTIADFVADIRAPTPSAAAELVSSDRSETLYRIQKQYNRLNQAIFNQLARVKHTHKLAGQRLQHVHPRTRLMQQAQRLDNISLSLKSALDSCISKERRRLNTIEHRLLNRSPDRQVAKHIERLSTANERIKHAMLSQLNRADQQLNGISQLMHSVSPLATMARGYNIAFKDDEIVNTVTQVKEGDKLTHKFKDGEITSEVRSISPTPSK
ncbi:exodeoxyribonuclease VII large subunit [Aestuariibacter sp. AA17]|uniref:Exodeoxyribonuclease 7 large subunit n=1 Tax=Fluctibacter corallii TaxID=2984329 RepID=A0ABT3AA31_9ALTE|nr:exodeoxyribonuclease VII large subunit [Aestuariibacter sp. AA17]MCV2885539.1 exodeoxyribonuclease VII large subunit [Aestuariibacter sp. AA17]